MVRCLPFRILMFSLVGGIFPNADQVHAADVVVVCSADFEPGLQPWLIDRRGRGLEVAIVRPTDRAQSQTAAIDRHVDDQTSSIVLVGDAPVYGQTIRPGEIASFELPTTVTAKFNSTKTFVTDLPYAGDRFEQIAVGRLPVRSAAQLAVVVQKILANDHSVDFGPWRSRLELVGGVGGFGMMIDSAIESTARTILTSSLPRSTRPGVLYGSPGHRFYPSGDSFRDAVIDRYRGGCRFWIYAGHGQVTSLDRVPPRSAADPAGGPPVLDNQSAGRLSGRYPTIALMLACFNGAIDAPPPCLAETLITSPGGPVAVIAGSRVTMPYGNSKLSLSLIGSVYQSKSTTLGQAWSSAIGRMKRADAPPSKTGVAMFLDAIATMMHGDKNIADQERIEHASLFQLIGDPTMRIHPPGDAEVAIERDETGSLDWQLTSPIDGIATLRIDAPLGGQTINPDDANQCTVWSKTVVVAGESLVRGTIQRSEWENVTKNAAKKTSKKPSGISPATATENAADDGVWADRTGQIVGDLPSGWYTLRVHIAGDDGWAAGSGKVLIP